MDNNQKPLLEVKNLKTYFYTRDGVVKAVDGVDFHVNPGEVLGLVGESGCGKSVTSLSIMRLIKKPGKITDGEVFFQEQNLLDLPEKKMVGVRGNEISIIFQQPQSSLNPVFTVGKQVKEVYQLHSKLNRQEMQQRAVDLFQQVGIPDADEKILAFPHEMSGGQAQRVMIAMGLALDPKLLIADEPTTALDVTIQAQILDLMRELKETKNTAMILITHDLGVIAEMADRVAVMYAGVILEQADVRELFNRPMHPYTQGLLDSIPVLGDVKEELEVIPGMVPSLVNLPPGCRFAPRCKARMDYDLSICTEVEPALNTAGEEHTVRCWLYQDYEGHIAPLNPKNE
ncbi:MAG TPA: ABC transporter ATP-binding protein [Anaerolineales bacterium]|nr:ABC transporter ATP-binding protein [Anaerolineales bacterium]